MDDNTAQGSVRLYACAVGLQRQARGDRELIHAKDAIVRRRCQDTKDFKVIFTTSLKSF